MYKEIKEKFQVYKQRKLQSQDIHQRRLSFCETEKLYLHMVRFQQELMKMIQDIQNDCQTFELTSQEQCMKAFDQIFPFLLAESPSTEFLQQVIKVHKVMQNLFENGRIIHEEHYDRYQFLQFYLRAVMIHNNLISYDKDVLLNFYDKICGTTNQEIKTHKLYHLLEQKLKNSFPEDTQQILEKHNQVGTEIFKQIETQKKEIKTENQSKTEFEKLFDQVNQKEMKLKLGIQDKKVLKKRKFQQNIPRSQFLKNAFKKSTNERQNRFKATIKNEPKIKKKTKFNRNLQKINNTSRKNIRKNQKNLQNFKKKKNQNKRKRKAKTTNKAKPIIKKIKKQVIPKPPKKKPKRVKKVKKKKIVPQICMFCHATKQPPDGPISFKFKTMSSFQLGKTRKTSYFYHKQCYCLNQGREVTDIIDEKVKTDAWNCKRKKCARCMQTKAFISCQNQKCKKHYHLSCIETLGIYHKCFKHIYKGRYDFYCHQHIDQRNEIDAAFDFAEKVCGFCQSSIHDEKIKQVMGELIGPYEALQGKQYYVHTYCALWAPQVFKSGNQIMGVGKELKRSQKLYCSLCHNIGASHGCFKDDCGEKFHIKCLFDKQGLDPKSEKNIERFTENVYCKRHEENFRSDNEEQTDDDDEVVEVKVNQVNNIRDSSSDSEQEQKFVQSESSDLDESDK